MNLETDRSLLLYEIKVFLGYHKHIFNFLLLLKPTCTPQKGEDDDDTDGGLGAIPFSLSWVMQQDDNAVRVSKDDKEVCLVYHR